MSKTPFKFKKSSIVKAAVLVMIGFGFHSAVTANALSPDEMSYGYKAEVSCNQYGKYYRTTHDIASGTIVERFVGREVKYEDVSTFGIPDGHLIVNAEQKIAMCALIVTLSSDDHHLF